MASWDGKLLMASFCTIHIIYIYIYWGVLKWFWGVPPFEGTPIYIYIHIYIYIP